MDFKKHNKLTPLLISVGKKMHTFAKLILKNGIYVIIMGV